MNEYLRRGWRCQHLPSGQRGRAHISIGLTAPHAGIDRRHRGPGGPRALRGVLHYEQADRGGPYPRLGLGCFICKMGAGVPASSPSSKSRRLILFLEPESLVGAEGIRLCSPRPPRLRTRDARRLWLQGQLCVPMRPAIPWEGAPPRAPAGGPSGPSSRPGQGLSDPHLRSLVLHSATGELVLCASVSFPGKCGTSAASQRSSLGTLQASGRPPFSLLLH